MGRGETAVRVLVTGGGGFLGGAIVRQLLERGTEVRSFARGDYPGLRDSGVDVCRGDLADRDQVYAAVKGCDAVIHVAARAGVWGTWKQFWSPNVLGTRHIIEALKHHGVERLIFTSSPSVVHGKGGIEGGDESLPYPDSYLANYPATKAEAERLVLAANGPQLATVALRPHLIWGPGDPQFLPRLVERSRAGKLAFVGNGSNKVDATYIEDAAQAHLLALDCLAPDAACAGSAYFITQGEPWPIRDVINGLLRASGAPDVTRTIQPWVAYLAGAILEAGYRLVGIDSEPPMTRFVAHQVSTSHWYDISAARKDLGYQPSVSMKEGLESLANSLGHSD
jgi:nucleoside-diphosphate-sugar epimerase